MNRYRKDSIGLSGNCYILSGSMSSYVIGTWYLFKDQTSSVYDVMLSRRIDVRPTSLRHHVLGVCCCNSFIHNQILWI